MCLYVQSRQYKAGLGPSCGGFPEQQSAHWWVGPACCYGIVGLLLHPVVEALWDGAEVINLYIGDVLAEGRQKPKQNKS